MAVNLIRKNNSDAITAAMDAAMYYMMIGEGIFSGIYQSCSASITNQIFTIQSGMISLGGRIVEIPENNPYVFDGLQRFGKEKTIYIKANVTIEADDSQSTATIYASLDGAQSARHALTGTNVYTTNLFSITYKNGSYSIKQIIATLEPGKAKYASALLLSGRIGSTPVTDIYETNGTAISKVKHCAEANVADVAKGFEYLDNGSGKNVNEVTESLYMPQRGVYLCVGAILMDNVTISNAKANDFAVDISLDDSAIEIPFESRASLSSIERYALIQCVFDDGTFVLSGSCLQNGENIVINDSTWSLKKCEMMINYNTRKVKIRFGSNKTKLTLSLRVIGIGGVANGN